MDKTLGLYVIYLCELQYDTAWTVLLFLKCWLPTSFGLLHAHWSTSLYWGEARGGSPGLAEWAAGMPPASEWQSLRYPFAAAFWEMSVYNPEREIRGRNTGNKHLKQCTSIQTHLGGLMVTSIYHSSVKLETVPP